MYVLLFTDEILRLTFYLQNPCYILLYTDEIYVTSYFLPTKSMLPLTFDLRLTFTDEIHVTYFSTESITCCGVTMLQRHVQFSNTYPSFTYDTLHMMRIDTEEVLKCSYVIALFLKTPATASKRWLGPSE